MSEQVFIRDEGRGEAWSVQTFVGVLVRIRDIRTGEVVEALVSTERARHLAGAMATQADEADRRGGR